MMQSKKLDRIMGLFFAISTVVLIYIFFTNRDFFTWAFQDTKIFSVGILDHCL